LHGSTSPPTLPRQPTLIYVNLRGLVFNNKTFLLLFLFSVADFFSRTKSFIDIEDEVKSTLVVKPNQKKNYLRRDQKR
jgi:hypothetical protein